MNRWQNAPVSVQHDEWVSQAEAAIRLRVALLRIGLTIPTGHLEPATSPDGEPGVSATSLAVELEWQRQATWLPRLLRFARDMVHWF